MSSFIQFWTFISNPNTFGPALVGFGCGFTVGMFAGKSFWNFIARRMDLRSKAREEKRQRKEEAAKKEFYRRKIVLDLMPDPKTGIITDPSNVPYCPDCFRHHRIVPLCRQGNHGLACTECGFFFKA